jgi:hypothetical protein
VLQAGGVIRHDVVESCEESCQVAVAVETLVGAAEVAQEGGWAIAGHGAFADARDSWGVVAAVGDGGVANVMRGGHEGDLPEEACLLEVTVGDRAGEVVGGYEPVLEVFRVRETPYEGAPSGIEVDAPHAHLGSIGRAQEGRLLGDDLSKVGWAVAQASSEGGKCVHMVAESLGDSDAAL